MGSRTGFKDSSGDRPRRKTTLTKHRVRGLNLKQKLFCEEYVVDFNGTAAAKRAGYAPKSAHVKATRLLRNDNVVAYIKELAQQHSRSVGITAQEVLEEIRRIGFSDVKDLARWNSKTVSLIPSDELSVEVSRAIQEVSGDVTITKRHDPETGEEVTTINSKIRAKMHPKLAALQKLGEHLGLFDIDTVATDTERTARELRDAMNRMLELTTGALEESEDDEEDD